MTMRLYNRSPKSLLFILVSGLLLLCIQMAAAINWDDGDDDGDPWYSSFHEPVNWTGDTPPAGQSCWLNAKNAGSPVVDQTETIWYLVVGSTLDLGTCQVYIREGADLRTSNNNHFYIGQNLGGRGVMNITGGQILAPDTGRIIVGNAGTGILNVSGTGYAEANTILIGNQNGGVGTLNIAPGGYVKSRDWCAVGFDGGGTLHMTGGTFYVENARLIVATPWADPDSGHIQLDGGTINVSDFELGDPGKGYLGTMDITDGTLIIRGRNHQTELSDIAAEGRLTAFNGDGDLHIVWDGVSTVVTATPQNPLKAFLPDPANGSVFIRKNPLLSWRAVRGADSHDVYFGTDAPAVFDAERLPGDLDGSNAVDLADLVLLAACWIDTPCTGIPAAVISGENEIGFRDFSLLAANWQLQGHEAFKANTTDASFLPGELLSGTTYYWRVDEIVGSNLYKGDVWNFTTALPPGVWQMHPREFICGTSVNAELRYINGSIALPPGSFHTVLFEPVSVKSLFHCPPSTDFEVVPYVGPIPNVMLETQPTTGIGTVEVKMSFPDGLDADASFALRFGNSTDGIITALVNAVATPGLTFETYSDLGQGQVSWYDMGWASWLPKFDIVPASASALRLVVPSLIQTSAPFALRLSVVDAYDNGANPVWTGTIDLTASGVSNLPSQVVLSPEDENSARIENLLISAPGIYRIQAALPGRGVFESNPVVVRESVTEPLYWGNIHNHGQYSEGWGDDLDTFYTFAKDISCMDYISLSDHLGAMPTAAGSMGRLLKWKNGYITTPLEAWTDTVTTANMYDDPGTFVTLVGYEWGSPTAGHYNVYYADADTDNMHEYFSPVWQDIEGMRSFLSQTSALFIPHKHAAAFPYEFLDWTVTNLNGYPLTPVIEVYSDWGDSFSPYGTWDINSLYGGIRNAAGLSYLWAVDNGYRIGLVGDSDSHTGRPGRRHPGNVATSHDHPQGLTAARTADFTREGIMHAYWTQNTYGTTGERIFLDIQANGARMGGSVQVGGAFDFHVQVAGTDIIESVSLYDGLTLIEKRLLGTAKDHQLVFHCPAPSGPNRPYLVLVLQQDENRAWSTPVWISPAN